MGSSVRRRPVTRSRESSRPSRPPVEREIAIGSARTVVVVVKSSQHEPRRGARRSRRERDRHDPVEHRERLGGAHRRADDVRDRDAGERRGPDQRDQHVDAPERGVVPTARPDVRPRVVLDRGCERQRAERDDGEPRGRQRATVVGEEARAPTRAPRRRRASAPNQADRAEHDHVARRASPRALVSEQRERGDERADARPRAARRRERGRPRRRPSMAATRRTARRPREPPSTGRRPRVLDHGTPVSCVCEAMDRDRVVVARSERVVGPRREPFARATSPAARQSSS